MATFYGMSVATWGPLAGGILSGKFTGQGAPPVATRVSRKSLGEREVAVARAVQEVAGELGATPAQCSAG